MPDDSKIEVPQTIQSAQRPNTDKPIPPECSEENLGNLPPCKVPEVCRAKKTLTIE